MADQANAEKCLVAGHKLAYLREGAGEPVLLVHGITTYSFIWRQIVPLLRPHYDVIAVDLLGCGDSDMPLDVSYSVKAQAERLCQFVEALNLAPIHFVGHDVGGGIGQVCAVRYHDRLRSLTLINTVGYDHWPVQPITALRTPIIRQLVMATLDLGTFELVVRRGLYHKERVTPELMNLFWKPLKTPRGRKAFLHLARCLDNRHLLEIADDLRGLRLPVLIVRGDADPYLSAVISERLHREIPDSRLVRVATGGHFIQEDEPEQVAGAMVEFFG